MFWKRSFALCELEIWSQHQLSLPLSGGLRRDNQDETGATIRMRRAPGVD